MGRRRILPPGFIEPCIPTLAAKPPSGPGWVHEIKHDGYRLIVRRDGTVVRLFTRRGHDWTERYPAKRAASKLRAKSSSRVGMRIGCGIVTVLPELTSGRRMLQIICSFA
jgi:ATP-dependent DNA ligase